MSAWQLDEEGYVAYDLHIWYIACMQIRYTHHNVPAYSHQGSFQIDKCAHLNTLYICACILSGKFTSNLFSVAGHARILDDDGDPFYITATSTFKM